MLVGEYVFKIWVCGDILYLNFINIEWVEYKKCLEREKCILREKGGGIRRVG